MMSTSIKGVAVLCAVVGVSAISGLAFADNQKFYDPFGDAPSTAYIGTDPNWYNTQWIGWKNKDTGACEWQLIGDRNGMTLPTNVYGLGGNDSLIVVSTPIDWCGYTITAPIPNQYLLILDGGAGNDTLWLGAFRGGMGGGPGDDYLYSTAANSWGYGEDGNDTLVMRGGPGSFAYGGNGNDCLNVNFMNSVDPFLCGAGNDEWWGSGTKPSDCEAVVCCGIIC